jgi:CheY-like chemotaxis protein
MKVLVVDDSPDAAEPLIAFLHLCGYETRVAYGATDALHLAATFQPDLALLDIGMPGVDGWILGGMLRGLPGLADLPIIAVTGYGSPADHQRSVDEDFQHHLVKPLDYTLLGRLMKAHEPASDQPAPTAPPEPSVAPAPAVPLAPPDVSPPAAKPEVNES